MESLHNQNTHVKISASAILKTGCFTGTELAPGCTSNTFIPTSARQFWYHLIHQCSLLLLLKITRNHEYKISIFLNHTGYNIENSRTCTCARIKRAIAKCLNSELVNEQVKAWIKAKQLRKFYLKTCDSIMNWGGSWKDHANNLKGKRVGF